MNSKFTTTNLLRLNKQLLGTDYFAIEAVWVFLLRRFRYCFCWWALRFFCWGGVSRIRLSAVVQLINHRAVFFCAELREFLSGYGVSVLHLFPLLDHQCVPQAFTNANDHPKVAFHLKYLLRLVAGVRFELTTFRLWAWRATGLLHPAPFCMVWIWLNVREIRFGFLLDLAVTYSPTP